MNNALFQQSRPKMSGRRPNSYQPRLQAGKSSADFANSRRLISTAEGGEYVGQASSLSVMFQNSLTVGPKAQFIPAPAAGRGTG